MKLTVTQGANANIPALSARCPHCGKEAVMSQLGQDLAIGGNYVCGQRVCPDPQCKGHLFVVSHAGSLLTSYPAIRIDFNAENIPDNVRETFEEALDCYAAGAFVACAIMVRRTLEEVCSDRGAKGGNLKARLSDLQTKIVLPKELIEAMDELRLLGNDAAHIEAQTFDQISTEELDVAIEFAKEILKGLYQYSSLLSKLRGLKK
ncbi:MAG: DUF4145 domain-containing protein [Chlorobi bacterium]|nr:DUF4145 domain-containing protein [Chlorobiota bacterium]